MINKASSKDDKVGNSAGVTGQEDRVFLYP